ncbi:MULTISPECIES: NAD(P)-dependent oxidoreductase [Sphingobium]|uniref:Oxidoreductase n=1 Tax=Sphingobium cupriresistens LL01 TaxID=1420583 RepID=A0A0J7XMA4_9SPHN|nr:MULTISPECIES: NAD(P)-dependent oxidoreductase [Sphingobium]KMS53071.1 oxidoreductase [Sphingobium cupriresistens LL01]WCP15346.1 putative oxidoreductase [Sphingobium sp. AntQ-1]
MKNAGVIGLGQIGAGVAICLARSGQLAAVYDVRADASDTLDGVPAVVASPAELARQADVVIIAVVNAKQTVDVLSGPDGVLAQARPGMSIVLVATVSIEDLNAIRALTDAAGVDLVDCGVTGGPKSRENGLVCLVGGTDESVARVRPVLDGFAKLVAHMGGPGAGMAAKIARNVIVFGGLRAGYEAAILCRNAGVDVRQLSEVIDASSDSVGGPLMLAVRDDPASSEQEAAIREYTRALMIKDLDAAIDLARSYGITLPLIELTRRTDQAVVGMADVMGEKA